MEEVVGSASKQETRALERCAPEAADVKTEQVCVTSAGPEGKDQAGPLRGAVMQAAHSSDIAGCLEGAAHLP
jgi:hypothetical protein